ncbi:MAG: site-specific DNA-methyltransferase, partial [Elusimicrobia bacterium]|nr:site-specific DNA-methyltransferase [Elusimicrobiota bacterium]
MVCRQLPLFEDIVATQLQICGPEELKQELRLFSRYGKNTSVYQTRIEIAPAKFIEVDTFANEFWTSKQRAANSLHEISYRACFKPQLPRFFIERLTKPEDVVNDPFMGRGTTLLEAAMLGRTPFGCDVNPLCGLLLQPRLEPPLIEEIKQRLGEIGFQDYDEFPEELLVFYHPETLKEICSLKKYLVSRDHCGLADSVDR